MSLSELAYILGAIFAPISLLGTIYMVVMWRRGLRSLEWPQTTGTVRASGLVEIAVPTDHGLSVVNYPEVRYEYEVGEIKYSSVQIKFGLGSCMKYLKIYLVGFEVLVCYDPDKPKISVLEPGWSTVDIFTIMIGLILSSSGIVMMAWLTMGG